MITNQEYFTIEVAPTIILGIPLDEMGTVAQFERANICTVPGVADFWHGVANFKGSLLWILDSNRFFDLKLQSGRLTPKLTAVVIKNQQLGDRKQVAIAVQHLKGIVSLETSSFQPISPQASPQIAQCCSSTAHVEGSAIYIIDSAALLQKLHQQSMLAST